MKPHNPTRREAVRAGAGLATAGALGHLFSKQLLALQNAGRVPVFDVLKYGAKGDGIALDTSAIQRAVNDASAAGKGAQVLVRGGHRYLIGSLELKGGIDFHLADDAELLLSPNRAHYSGSAAITALEAHGLRISGTGRINGQFKEFMTHYDEHDEWWRPKDWRPRMFVLTACKDLEIRDITFGDSPEWGLHMLGCDHVLVDHVKVRNNLEVPNCDGIDPDHCRDVEILNCDVECGDDAICVKTTARLDQAGAPERDYGPSANIRVADCVILTQDSGVKIGSNTAQDIHNVRFERCEIKSSCRGVAIQLRDEGNIYDIGFRDIKFVSRYYSDPWWGRGEAISFTAIPRTPATKVGTIHHVRVQNVTGKAENSVRVDGTKQSRIHDVLFENVSVTLDRWTRYKGGLFDNRPPESPSNIEPHGNPGFNIRYADKVVLKHCSVTWGANRPDYFTNALEAQEATDLELSQFSGEAAHPDLDAAILIR